MHIRKFEGIYEFVLVDVMLSPLGDRMPWRSVILRCRALCFELSHFALLVLNGTEENNSRDLSQFRSQTIKHIQI